MNTYGSENASPRVRALSRDIIALLRERRSQDSRLSILELLTALDLTRLALLQESAVANSAHRRVAAVAVALAIILTGAMLIVIAR